MNREAQKMAIATACGWTNCRLGVYGNGAPERKDTAHGFPPGKNYIAPCPDYLNDLDAMHEVEKVLTHDQRISYGELLMEMCKSDMRKYGCIFATSDQRAEAFLRTIGEWVEE